MRTSRFSRALAWLSCVLALTFTLAGCDIGGTTSGASQPTSAPQATQPAATATAVPNCQAISGFASAGAASAGQGFNDVFFPAGAISTPVTTSGGGADRFTIKQLDVCAPSSTVDSIHSFYAGGFPNNAWAQSSSFPYDGAAQASCGDPYCWHIGKEPRYASLEKVTDKGNGLIVYHLRLALPPSAPICTPDPAAIYGTRPYDTNLPSTASIPAPPLTKDGLGDGSGVGSLTRFSEVGECTPGTNSALDTFFNTELPHAGWHHSAPPSSLAGPCETTGTQWWKGNQIFSWNHSGAAGAGTIFWGYSICQVG